MPTAPTGRATRAHLKTSLATRRLRDQGLKHGPRPSAIVSNFPQPAVLRLLPTRETLARQHARWPRRISLRDGGQRDRACVATGAYIRSCELSSVVERAHSNVARKTKGWLEHEIHHAAETREAYSLPVGHTKACDRRRSQCSIRRRDCCGPKASSLAIWLFSVFRAMRMRPSYMPIVFLCQSISR